MSLGYLRGHNRFNVPQSRGFKMSQRCAATGKQKRGSNGLSFGGQQKEGSKVSLRWSGGNLSFKMTDLISPPLFCKFQFFDPGPCRTRCIQDFKGPPESTRNSTHEGESARRMSPLSLQGLQQGPV